MTPPWLQDAAEDVSRERDGRRARVDSRRMAAFEASVRAHTGTLYGLAMRLSGNKSDANDLVQDTFERALRNFDRLVPGTNERAWLCTILHHLFIDLCRRRRRERARDEEAPEPACAPHDHDEEPPAWARITVDEVRAALEELDEEFRTVYRMHAVEGRPYAEIAERLGIPKVTVGTRLLRARRKLKQLLTSRAERRGGTA